MNCPPTFGMYSFDSDLNCARLVQVLAGRISAWTWKRSKKAVIQEQVKVVFIASPNNPDGGLLPRAEIERLLRLPVLIVLDEAYMEFAPAGSSMLSQVSQRNNLVVLANLQQMGRAGRVAGGLRRFSDRVDAASLEDQTAL